MGDAENFGRQRSSFETLSWAALVAWLVPHVQVNSTRTKSLSQRERENVLQSFWTLKKA